MKIHALCLSLLCLTGCSIAPLATPNGGSTVGRGETQVSTNLAPALAVNVAIGVSDNTDVGITAEQQLNTSYSIWAKHSLLNQAQGPAVALLAGVFKSGSGAHSRGYYSGPAFSYRSGKGELYTTIRYNRVYWDGYDVLSDGENDELLSIFEVDDDVFYYWQADIGVHLHTSERVQFSLGANCVALEGDTACLPILGAGFKM